MPRRLQSFPDFDSSDSASLGDDRRVVLIKGALLAELVQQSSVLTQYMQWTVKAGLHTVMQDVLDGKQPVTTLIAAIPPVAKQLHQEVATLVAKLGLPYRWVHQGLLHGFGAGLVGIATGQEVVLPIPQINVTYDPTRSRPPGRKSDHAVIERYTKWYVSCRIGGVEERVLAKEYHETHTHPSSSTHTWREDRKTISNGIKEIERLLLLTK
ncbi:MAG: hypothetical protein AB7F94_18620 [Nitrospira sp.]